MLNYYIATGARAARKSGLDGRRAERAGETTLRNVIVIVIVIEIVIVIVIGRRAPSPDTVIVLWDLQRPYYDISMTSALERGLRSSNNGFKQHHANPREVLGGGIYQAILPHVT